MNSSRNMQRDQTNTWSYISDDMVLISSNDADKQYMIDKMKNNKYSHARIEIPTSCTSHAQTPDNTARGDRSVASDPPGLSACSGGDPSA